VAARLLIRSTVVLSLLFAMLFGVLWAAGTLVGLSIGGIVAIGIVLLLLQYLIGPSILGLVFQIRWVDLAEEVPDLDREARRICEERRIPYPRFGVIEDGKPNAFTYGHHPWNARLVVTRGLLRTLGPEEREAVLAHELGHIKHWDVVVMTLASLIPLLLYLVARVLLDASGSASRNRSGDSQNNNQGAAYVGLVGLVALVLYFVSEYIVLFLSRIRELYADDFSADSTRDPDSLSSALVKIAYGLASLPAEAGKEARRAAGLRMLGIFDPHTAGNLARAVSGEPPRSIASARGTRTFTEQDMVRAMRWDVWNPWAKVYQLSSTHPLPAVRIGRLREKAAELGKSSRWSVPETPPESYWDEFVADVFTARLILFGILAGGALFLGLHEWFSTTAVAGLWVAVVGLALGWKVAREYPRSPTDWQVRGLVQEVKVSRVRGIPARLRGRVIGRGVPGLIYSPHLALDDGSGFITMQYRQPVPGWGLLFGMFKVDEIIRHEGVAEGWFRRAPAPYFEVLTFEYSGRRVTTYWFAAKRLLAWLMVAAGAITFLVGLFTRSSFGSLLIGPNPNT
jgi:Zn-dependent protease with chaperone function